MKIRIKKKNIGKLTETMRRTGKSKYELAHSKNPLTRKRALFAINASHWKHDEGGHLFLEDGWINTNLLTLFDKYGPKALVVEIDKPVRLNEVQVVADAPKPGSPNYDRYIANTYNAWQRGDVDINTLPTETRNRVRGYSGTIAALRGINEAGEKLFPYIIGLSGGPAGLFVGATSIGASLLVDSSVNNLTKGENETWGDWLSDVFGIENPYGRGAMELTNPAFWPGYIYGGVNAFNKAANSKTIGTLRIANLMRRDINRNKKGLNLALDSFNYDNILKERNALAGNSYFHGTTVKPNVDVSPAWGGSLIGKDPGMFVSYGEPWIERSLAKSMYVFPEETFGIRKATDAYGNILKQSVNLLGKNKLAISTAYKVNPILDLAWSKFTGKPEYKAEYVLPNGNVISESARDAFFDIYHGNQTVIPKDLFRYALQNTPYRVHYANGPDRALIEYNPNLGNRFKLSFTEDDYSKFLDDWINGEATMISDIPQTGNTGVRASLSGIKQADKDIPLMSQYHDANVLEYNLATGNNVESVPFRTDVTGRLIKIMPDEEFNQHFSIRKTNSPLDDIERVGGAYSKTDDAVYLRLSGSESNAYHETLHSRKYGETNPEVTQWRMNQMLSDEAVSKMTQRQKEYYLGNGEFPTHMRLLGKDMGISVAQEYPGDDKFVEMLVKKMSDDGIGGAAHFTKIMDMIDNPASVSHIDKMILWKGLNGTAFSILGGVGLYGLQNKINKQ